MTHLKSLKINALNQSAQGQVRGGASKFPPTLPTLPPTAQATLPTLPTLPAAASGQ